MSESNLSPPRRLRMQFGLRTALVLMTLSAVGVALWTRWPYAVEEKVANKLWREAAANKLTDQWGNVIAQREAAYYRRLLGGDRVRHGESLLYINGPAGDKQLVVRRTFREGVLHGPYRELYTSGAVRSEGDFNRGRKHGKWLFLGQPEREQADTDYRLTQHWNLGVPHGEWQWEDGYSTVYLKVTYDTGRVKTIDGEPVTDWLDEICRHLPSGTIADRWRLFRRHQANGGYPEWMKDPLASWPNIEVEYDPRLPPLPPDETPQVIRSVPFAVSLAADLHRTKRAATRRFNCLYVTKLELIGPEHDQTGVSSLDPVDGSLVGMIFEKNVKLTGKEINFNLRQALHYFEHELGLPIDDSALDRTLEPRDEDRSWAPFARYNEEYNIRDLFGLALHRARCRCELVNGVLKIRRQ